MVKIGNYDYPDMQVGTLLKALEVLVKDFQGFVKDENFFATKIGHKSTNSGTYITKIATLRKYGLLEPRELRTTQIANEIIKPLNSLEKSEKLSRIILSVSLWNDIYTRLKTKNPASEEFKIALIEITNDKNKTLEEYEKIRNLYIEAMGYYNDKIVGKNSDINSKEKIDIQKDKKLGEKVPENILIFKSGEIDITLPKNDTNLKILGDIINGMKIKK